MRPLNIKVIGIKPIILIVLFFSIIFATAFIQAKVNDQPKVIYKASYKNSEIGFIEDINMIDQAMKDATSRLEEQLDTVILVDEMVITQPVKMDKQILLTDIELTDRLFTILLFNKDEFLVKANVLSIDENTKIIVKDEETAESILAEVKSAYVTPENEENIEDISFVESVEASPIYVNQTSIAEKNEAVEKLQSTTEEKITYEIQSGDTLSEVANDNGMGLSELLKINPAITRDTLIQIGQEVNLMIPKPLLSVQIKEKITYQENIKAPIEYKEDDSEYKIYKKTIQQGEPGVKEITANVIRINGLEAGREIISEKVIIEPTKSIIVVGIRSLPSFSMPVYGRLTSSYGPRWGSTHTGIDIAVPTGTKVKASEAGTVTFSGWGGGYGYLVKIRHGEGFETYYAHNSKLYVKVGEKVSKGEVIAASGSTGNSTGPHVHLEIRRYGDSKNPYNYLSF